MQAPLQIKVLGELAVVREAQEMVLPASKKTRALLAYLALANRRQRRDHLCEMLWNAPDDRASLRWSLTKLRRVLNEDGDEPCLRTDGNSVLLDASRPALLWRIGSDYALNGERQASGSQCGVDQNSYEP